MKNSQDHCLRAATATSDIQEESLLMPPSFEGLLDQNMGESGVDGMELMLQPPQTRGHGGLHLLRPGVNNLILRPPGEQAKVVGV